MFLKSGGKVVIPAFAMQRSQDIMKNIWKFFKDEDFNYPIYIDGVLKNSISRTFSNRYINNGGNCIGTEVNNSSVYNLNGDISDIRMYTTALSAEDIKELYNTSCIINS